MSDPRFPALMATALAAVFRWLESSEVPHALIGGIAVSILSEPRTTKDIDAVVWLEEMSTRDFLNSAVSAGFTPRTDDPVAFAQDTRMLLLKHRESGINVDLSLGALPFEKEMIEHATLSKVGTISLRVARPEDLIITKAVALRPQDIADIDSLLTTNPKVDYNRIRSVVNEFQQLLERPEYVSKLEDILRSHMNQ